MNKERRKEVGKEGEGQRMIEGDKMSADLNMFTSKRLHAT